MSAKEPLKSQSIEEKVEKWVERLEPDAAFARDLRARVMEQAVLRSRENPRRVATVPRARFYSAWRLGLALAGMALLVAFLVFSIGLLPKSSLSPAGGPTGTVNLLAISPTPEPSTATPAETGQSEKQTPQIDSAQHYVVQEGDTWTGIASTFGLTPEELRSLNGMSEGALLYVGQKLIVSRAGQAGLSSMYSLSHTKFFWRRNPCDPGVRRLRHPRECIVRSPDAALPIVARVDWRRNGGERRLYDGALAGL